MNNPAHPEASDELAPRSHRDDAFQNRMTRFDVALRILTAATLLVAGCSRTSGAEAERVSSQAIATLAGVAFQPPIGEAEILTGTFDSTAQISIEIFKLRRTKAFGSPVGPSLSTVSNTVTVTDQQGIEEAYEATWHTRDSDQPNGSILRVEVRLPQAEPGEPACNGKPNMDGGCLAYFDAKLWRSGTDVEANPSGPGTVDLINGSSIDIRFHIAIGALAARIDVEPDLTAPVVMVEVPEANREFPAGTPIDVKGTVHEQESAPSVELYAGPVSIGRAVLEATEDATMWSFQIEWTPQRSGVVDLFVIAHDGAGNMGSALRTVTIR